MFWSSHLWTNGQSIVQPHIHLFQTTQRTTDFRNGRLFKAQGLQVFCNLFIEFVQNVSSLNCIYGFTKAHNLKLYHFKMF